MQKVKTHKRVRKNGVVVVRQHLRKAAKRTAKRLYKSGEESGVKGMRIAITSALEREAIERGHKALRREAKKSQKK